MGTRRNPLIRDTDTEERDELRREISRLEQAGQGDGATAKAHRKTLKDRYGFDINGKDKDADAPPSTAPEPTLNTLDDNDAKPRDSKGINRAAVDEERKAVKAAAEAASQARADDDADAEAAAAVPSDVTAAADNVNDGQINPDDIGDGEEKKVTGVGVHENPKASETGAPESRAAQVDSPLSRTEGGLPDDQRTGTDAATPETAVNPSGATASAKDAEEEKERAKRAGAPAAKKAASSASSAKAKDADKK